MNTPNSHPSSVAPLAKLDRFMAEHPWHPRFITLFLYVGFLTLAGFVAKTGSAFHTAVYTAGLGAIAWTLWRYRRLIPELNWRFHWLAIPVAVVAVWAWVELGLWMGRAWPDTFGKPGDDLIEQQGAAGWVSLIVRTWGMSFLVPMVEEPAFRSAMMRSLSSWRTVGATAIHLLEDVPVLGDRVLESRWSKWADRFPQPIRQGYEATELGVLTSANLVMVSVIWCLVHAPRDWPGVVACSLLYAGVTWWTNRGGRKMGLGPVMWAHGLTNLLLCVYTVWKDDWRFL